MAKDYYEAYWSKTGFRPTSQWYDDLGRLLTKYVSPSMSCLDLGCGDGTTAGLWLAEHAAHYVGVDISATAVDAARALGLDARTIQDASSVPFEASSFDVVICVEVLEHLFDPESALMETIRVLKPGGRLLATVPNVVFWRRRREMLLGSWNPLGDARSVEEPWRDPHIRFFTPAATRRLLIQCGFTDIEICGHGGRAPTDPWVDRIKRELKAKYPALFAYRLHIIGRKPSE